VLSEPAQRQERYRRNLPQYRQDQALLDVGSLMKLNDYPQERLIRVFYAQSVSVVDFLSKEQGPATFTQFVREGMKGDYEAALRKYYKIQDFAELEQRWRRFAFSDTGAYAERGR
jgi:hypothetical protein